MVLDRDRLTVKRERPEFAIALEQIEQTRDHHNEPRPVHLELLVPLAIPVRVRDDEGAPTKAAAQQRDRRRSREARDRADRHPAKHVEGVMDADHDAGDRGGDPEQQERPAVAR